MFYTAYICVIFSSLWNLIYMILSCKEDSIGNKAAVLAFLSITIFASYWDIMRYLDVVAFFVLVKLKNWAKPIFLNEIKTKLLNWIPEWSSPFLTPSSRNLSEYNYWLIDSYHFVFSRVSLWRIIIEFKESYWSSICLEGSQNHGLDCWKHLNLMTKRRDIC